MLIAEPVFDIRAEHGEGPVWDPINQELFWVDLIQGKVHRAHIANGQIETYQLGQPVGVIALRQQGGLVVAVRDGFGFFDLDANRLELLEENAEKDNPEVRFNDGAIDPDGRFLAGTMSWDGVDRLGKLFALHKDHSITLLEQNLFISNGMTWSGDGETYFFIDTLQHAVFAYDYDSTTGQISNRRIHIQFERTEFPDGMAADTDGGFWIAFYGGSKVVHYGSDGSEIEQVKLPVMHPTSCCFGGPNLSTLFITTSQIALSDRLKSDHPTAGYVFRVETLVEGVPQRRFAG